MIGQFDDATLGGGLGDQGVGLGLEAGDLALELQAQHLALDGSIGQFERLRVGRRDGVLRDSPR